MRPTLLVLGLSLLLLGACTADFELDLGPGDAFVAADVLDAGQGDDADAEADPFAAPVIPEGLDELIAYHMNEGAIPGLAASIVTAEGIAFSGYYGFADIEAERPVDEDSLFVVASVSKTITTLAALQLVDEELLDLDVAADDYLPYALRHPDFADDAISARMLMTHTSGLTDSLGVLGRATYMSDPEVGLAEFSEGYVTPMGAFFDEGNWGPEPGTRRVYCNANFALVGHLVESIRGQDLRVISAERIFEPLGMTSTGWFLEDVDETKLATPYTYDGRENVPLEHFGFSYYPAGSLRTNIPDLSRFLQATLRDGELDGERVLSETLSRSMRLGQRLDINPRQAVTWSYQNVGGEQWLAHTGNTYGASAIIAYRPDDGVGMIVMTNSDAFLRARFGLRDSLEALEAIFARIAEESVAYR